MRVLVGQFDCLAQHMGATLTVDQGVSLARELMIARRRDVPRWREGWNLTLGVALAKSHLIRLSRSLVAVLQELAVNCKDAGAATWLREYAARCGPAARDTRAMMSAAQSGNLEVFQATVPPEHWSQMVLLNAACAPNLSVLAHMLAAGYVAARGGLYGPQAALEEAVRWGCAENVQLLLKHWPALVRRPAVLQAVHRKRLGNDAHAGAATRGHPRHGVCGCALG